MTSYCFLSIRDHCAKKLEVGDLTALSATRGQTLLDGVDADGSIKLRLRTTTSARSSIHGSCLLPLCAAKRATTESSLFKRSLAKGH